MRAKTKGITLVELVLVVVVMAVIMAALAPYIGAIQRVWQWGDRRTEMMQHGRVSLDRMVRTLRNCATIVAIDGNTGQGTFVEFTNADGDQIAYFHNVTDNTAYYDATLGDNNLGMRTISAGVTTTSLLAEAVQSITFSYYKHEMDTSTPPVAIRTPATTVGEVGAVDIEMQLSDPEGEITSTLPLTSFVFCRVVETVSGGEAWVTDYYHNQVVKLDSGGTELLRVGGFNKPAGVSVNPTDGSCWVADTYNDQVVKLDSNGTQMISLGYFSRPESVSVNPTDGSCWVAEWMLNGQVVKLDSGGTELLRVLGSFGFVLSVAVNPTDGSCWFAAARQVGKLDSNNGTQLVTVGGFDWPISVSVNPTDGSCWVADSRNARVVKLDSDGTELVSVGVHYQAVSVSVNPTDGSCWATSTHALKLDSNGAELLRVGGFNHPSSISVDTGERQ